MTAERIDPCPMKLPMLTDFWSASSFARNGASGTGDPPSGPSITRRHALPDVVVGGRDLEDAATRVRVNVDEAGAITWPPTSMTRAARAR